MNVLFKFIVFYFILLYLKNVQALSEVYVNCDILVAGGSTASLAAALNAARESPQLTICLTEPTSWLGGQLTSSGVSAVDFGQYNRDSRYQSVDFIDMMNSLGAGNPGNCWVSTKCFLPTLLINNWIPAQLKKYTNLKVFYNTVIKKVNKDDSNHIVEVIAIQRTEKLQVDQWNYFLSQMINDWYSTVESNLFTKQMVHFFSIKSDTKIVVIDATEYGDVLALAGASYRIGVETPFENSTNTIENCGQAFTFPFYMVVNNHTVPPFNYSTNETYFLDRPWGQIWSYRRSLAKPGDYHSAKIGEISNQNWGDGNDFKARYLFLSIEETNKQLNDWKGGIDISALNKGEQRALGWFWYYKYNNSTPNITDLLSLGLKDIVGTNTGLSMVPYLRDTRRSIGLDGFLLKKSDFENTDNSSKCGFKFDDRIAIGNYLYADIHSTNNCVWPQYAFDNFILPYYIPFRALTNKDISNLLVAGKTMSQTFMANAATRLHPIEWNTGIAAGIAATIMSNNKLTSRQIYETQIAKLQQSIKNVVPIDWDIC